MPLSDMIGSLSDTQSQMFQGVGDAITERARYNRSRKDWEAQNEYNSPVEQMKRLKDAGLNPHLIYGNGSAATGTAGPIEQPQGRVSGLPSPKIAAQYDLEMKKVQTDNLKEVGEGIKLDNAMKAFDLEFKSDSRVDQLGIIGYKNSNLLSDFLLKDQSWKFNELKNSATLKQMAVQLGISEATLAQKDIDMQIKQAELELRKMGINPNSSSWVNVGVMLLTKILGKNPMDLLNFK